MKHVIGLVTMALLLSSAQAETAAEVLGKAREALTAGRHEQAVRFATKAIEFDPKNPRAYFIRANAHDLMQNHAEAVKDYGKTIELNPDLADAYDRRGSAYFKLVKINESIADFDAFLKLKPQEAPGHWRRGISYYYADRFADGSKQFEGYETVDTNDVENAVWRYICQARVYGHERARASMLKIGFDRRVPLMKVYELFLDKAKPEDVLAAANAGKPPPKDLKTRLFYAHLYLGLYHESKSEAKLALEHMKQAAEDYNVGGYMWDVARVHVALRQAK